MLVLKRKQFATWGVPFFKAAGANFKTGGANLLKSFRNQTFNTNRSLNLSSAQRWRTGLKGGWQLTKGAAQTGAGVINAGANLIGKTGKGLLIGSGITALAGAGAVAGAKHLVTDSDK